MEKRIYTASEGKTFRRKVDGHIMGNRMILGKFVDGTEDVIENYEEVVNERPIGRRHNRDRREEILARRKNPHRPSRRR